MNIPINCIFHSFEGEGIHIGRKQVFIRLQGCRIGCVNCDEKETWPLKDLNWKPLTEVIAKTQELTHKHQIQWVSITGGNPLDERYVDATKELAANLKALNLSVNVEAAGDKVDDELFDLVDSIGFDIKTPCTKRSFGADPVKIIAEKYPHKSQIKFVCKDSLDLDYVNDIYNELGELAKNLQDKWVITPEFNVGETDPLQKIQALAEYNNTLGSRFRLICQQHKFVYGSEAKQV